MTWYTDPIANDAPIISARVRLARNLKKYPFKQMMTGKEALMIIEETSGAVINDRTAIGVRFKSQDIKQLNETAKKMLIEKHIISHDLLKPELPVGLLLQDDENVSIMINEEDHIRMQTVSAGDNIAASWELANHIDDLIEESVEYAFDKDFGYLTSCPTNTGTGLRASYMIHLPMLEKTGKIKFLIPAINKFGIALRGLHGEGTEPMGSIYQISNQLTLGKSEQEIMQGLQNVTQNIIEKEKMICEKMLEKHRIDLENNVYRAYGILSFGKKISLAEAMNLLSEIRVGFYTGVLCQPKLNKNIYQVMIEIQNGHLQNRIGRKLGEEECEIYRADILREMFN
ncbi:MAG: protein arginine kinase [Defluviitaleaceae bacterium]|nr:protein arginine kinase [Defluviitaleaceae bacterium]